MKHIENKEDLVFSLDSEKSKIWRNVDNKEIYSKIPINDFKKFALTSGIKTNKDVKVLYNRYIETAESVLELGAGYGRVIAELLNRRYKGQVHAIERNKGLYKLLKSKFSNDATIRCEDIYTLALTQKFDAILWLWCGLAEFSKTEQLTVLKRISSALKESGYMIIDSILIQDNISDKEIFSIQNHSLKTQHGISHHYFPTCNEFKIYAGKLRIVLERIIPYTTTLTKKTKALYIFRRPNS